MHVGERAQLSVSWKAQEYAGPATSPPSVPLFDSRGRRARRQTADGGRNLPTLRIATKQLAHGLERAFFATTQRLGCLPSSTALSRSVLHLRQLALQTITTRRSGRHANGVMGAYRLRPIVALVRRNGKWCSCVGVKQVSISRGPCCQSLRGLATITGDTADPGIAPFQPPTLTAKIAQETHKHRENKIVSWRAAARLGVLAPL
jgi:hypothetical protein